MNIDFKLPVEYTSLEYLRGMVGVGDKWIMEAVLRIWNTLHPSDNVTSTVGKYNYTYKLSGVCQDEYELESIMWYVLAAPFDVRFSVQV